MQFDMTGSAPLANMYAGIGMQEQEAQRERNRQAIESARQVAQDRTKAKVAPWEGAAKGIEGGLDQYERAQARKRQDQEAAMRAREFERQGIVAEEQLAASRAQRERQAQMQPLEAEALKTQVETAKAQQQTAKLQAEAMIKEQEFLQGPAQGTPERPAFRGETNAQYKARMEIEQNGFNATTARLNVDNARLELENAKKLGPAQLAQAQANLKAAQMDLKERERAAGVKDLTNRLLTENDPKRRAIVIEQLKRESVPAAQLAEAINSANTSDAQKAFLAKQIDMMDPLKQSRVQALVQGQTEARTFMKASSDLETALRNYENANLLGNDTDIHLANFQAALRDAGEEKLADSLDSPVELSKLIEFGKGYAPGKAFGRTERMREAAKWVRERWAGRLQSLSAEDPRFADIANQVRIPPNSKPRGQGLTKQWVDKYGMQNIVPADGGMTQAPPASLQQLQTVPGFIPIQQQSSVRGR